MLSWYVYVDDFNGKTIREFNIFDHGGFRDDVEKAVKKRLNREQFEKAMRSSLMYWYWSKCEWEVVVDHWPPTRDNKYSGWARKVDVFKQVDMNWPRFIDYLWKNRREVLARVVCLDPGEEEQMVMKEFKG